MLYLRNLGVFYNSLLNPYTAHNQQDWENRQRIYLQSALYALDVFSTARDVSTTLAAFGPRSAGLTQVHPGSVASDTLYGLFYALHALQDENRYGKRTTFRLQTVTAARQLIADRRKDLKALLDIYLRQVQDSETKLIRKGLDLASARDGVVRDRSLYDNIVLWKTLELAQSLRLPGAMSKAALERMRQEIIARYWDDQEGHFKDDLSTKRALGNYSSDWLIALPTGFLQFSRTPDLQFLKRTVAFMREQKIDVPFPIKYQATNEDIDAPWAVRTFVPNYGGDAIWSYWGRSTSRCLLN